MLCPYFGFFLFLVSSPLISFHSNYRSYFQIGHPRKYLQKIYDSSETEILRIRHNQVSLLDPEPEESSR